MRKITQPIAALDDNQVGNKVTENIEQENKQMRIAIPLADGKLAMHFGHCERFALVDVDPTEKKILKREDIAAPPHEPGLLPKWLAERGAEDNYQRRHGAASSRVVRGARYSGGGWRTR